jgi:hypothetical protein
MSFWEVLWFIFISFALVAYLMVMFAIIGDLFRDRDTSGVVKAIWIFALIFLPILTSLVYLITRGQAMTERAARDAESAQARQDAYIRDVAAKGTPADQIAQARSMLDAGVINQAEYERLKEKALV